MFATWWYGYTGYGWWWWWIAFVLIFFLIPLGYGWGYRGWGPWYRRRNPRRSPGGELPPGNAPSSNEPGIPPAEEETGWGWSGAFLWFILIIAIIWLVAAWGWGTW
jgi:hypothetical protein